MPVENRFSAITDEGFDRLIRDLRLTVDELNEEIKRLEELIDTYHA